MNEIEEYLSKIVRQAETEGFACNIMRTGNDYIGIIFSKSGNFTSNQQKIRSILYRIGFRYTTQIVNKIKYLPCYGYLYVNFDANIGCFIECDRHRIELFPNLRDLYE